VIIPEQKTVGCTLLIYSKTLPVILRRASNEKHMQSSFQQSLYVFFFFLREVLAIHSMKFMYVEDSSLRRATLWSTWMCVCSTRLSQQKILGLNVLLTEGAERRDCTDASISRPS